jgi:hypothetical protein
MKTTSHAHNNMRLRTALGLAGMLVFTACASTPPAPTASLEAARQAISTAERAEAGRFASTELAEARDKLASANTAVANEKMIQAAQLADQSRVEAELASARTAALKARTVNDEMKRSTGTLIQEMQRSSGDST